MAMADPSGRRPRHHPAVNDILSTLAVANAALADVQRRLDLEFRASYPDHTNPAKLVARVKRVQEAVAALKELCRDLLTQKQELIDRIHVSLMAQRSTTQRLLAASGLPPLSDVDEAAHNTLNAVIDEWTAHVSPVTGRTRQKMSTRSSSPRFFFEETGRSTAKSFLFSAII
ncbi:hypothetical protein PVAP13_1KG532100 [Panicum virgatum]|uniref:Protein FAM33A n=1 Tax=Panicum virgatum TaxID=38727 RepID=A0A8T0XYI5_PANVG|nr:hypothetical protein PVAP13_1KG532100 [Panicum virgatum]